MQVKSVDGRWKLCELQGNRGEEKALCLHRRNPEAGQFFENSCLTVITVITEVSNGDCSMKAFHSFGQKLILSIWLIVLFSLPLIQNFSPVVVIFHISALFTTPGSSTTRVIMGNGLASREARSAKSEQLAFLSLRSSTSEPTSPRDIENLLEKKG